MSTEQRKLWEKETHENKVESFYGWGVDNFGDFHNGYLNFGLWESGLKTYLEAAENMVHRIATLAGVNQNSHLLDVGFGMGTQDVYILEKFSPKKIDGLDVTWKHVELARRRAERFKCGDRVEFHHGTATKIPFPDGYFSNVMSIEAPEHFDTRQMFFEESYRVLKPGGVIGIADYTLKREPRNFIEKAVLGAVVSLWKVPQDNVYSTETYRQRLAKVGYKNIDIQEVGALTIPGYYYEQKRPEVKAELAKIRGFVAGRLGFIIDIFLFQAYQYGLLEYILVHAEKK